MVGSVGGQGRLGLAALAPAGPPAWVAEARAGEEIALTQPAFAYDLHLHANHRWLRTHLEYIKYSHRHKHTQLHTYACMPTLTRAHISMPGTHPHFPTCTCILYYAHTRTHSPPLHTHAQQIYMYLLTHPPYLHPHTHAYTHTQVHAHSHVYMLPCMITHSWNSGLPGKTVPCAQPS